MKDTNRIKELLDLYWECETTIEQENILKNYFTGSEISEELLPYVEYFSPLKDLAIIELEKPLEQMLPKSKVVTLSLKKYIYAAAAVVVLALCSIWVVNSNLETKSSMAEVQDTEEALQITKEALALLSNTLNTGSSKVKKNIQHIDKLNIIK